ncbi:MAG TPA: hypothetical protein VLB12_07345 [Gemmatimonadales bacterium]|nr:hypothetical protein [Gemmatimonadales bacterium]
MNGAHLHLIVTHLPVLGVAFGTVLLGFGLFRRSRTVQQVGLSVLVLAGLSAGAAYLSGEGAEEAMERTLGAGKPFLERHEEAGVFGLVAAGIAGALALVTLASGWRNRPLSRAMVTLNVLIALVASGTLAWVANLGGQIGHPEIRSGQSASMDDDRERDESP